MERGLTRILHILGTAEVEGAGVAHIVDGLARLLDPADFETCACFIGPKGPLIEGLGSVCRGVYSVPLRGRIIGSYRLHRLLRRLRPDIVHQHTGGPRLTQFLRTASGAKIVLQLHGSVNEQQGVEAGPLSARHTDAVIAVSHAVARAARLPNCRVIYPGVELGDHSTPRIATSPVSKIVATVCK